MYLFAKQAFKKIDVHWVPKFDIEFEANRVKNRFDIARLIPGTQKLHSYEPISRNKIQVRQHTSSSDLNDVYVSKE